MDPTKPCRRCGAIDYTRSGFHGGKQRWACRLCDHELRAATPALLRHFTRLSSSAKQRGIPCTITLEQMPPVPDACVICGGPWGLFSQYDYSSTDRIHNDLGYVAGNIQYVHVKCNTLKSDHTVQTAADTLRNLMGRPAKESRETIYARFGLPYPGLLCDKDNDVTS